jgi:hypothetical protein
MKLPSIHRHRLHESAALSRLQVRHVISPLDVIAALDDAGVRFVLIGAHGLSGWTAKPRATQDVDVVVMNRHLKKATKALLAAFPDLEARDEPAVTRLCNRKSGTVIIDLVKQRELYRETFKHTHAIVDSGRTYLVPSLEMALAMKFAAMQSPNRDEAARLLDAHDFIRMARVNPQVDSAVLAKLGDMVLDAGGRQLLEMVRKAKAGEKLML